MLVGNNLTVNLGGITYHCKTAGPWVSTEIFFKGCARSCDGCFNSQLQDTSDMHVFKVNELVDLLLKNVPYKRVTISGGEPFLQTLALYDLVTKLKSHGFIIICYTGNELFDIQCDIEDPHIPTITQMCLDAILHNIDILVDGEFMIDKKVEGVGFKPGLWIGSTNQRAINMPQTLKEGDIVLWR